MVEEASKQQSIRQIEQDEDFQATEKNDTTVVLSALAEHEKSTGHHIDWSDVRILWKDNVAYRLLIKESVVIRAYESVLNRTTH